MLDHDHRYALLLCHPTYLVINTLNHGTPIDLETACVISHAARAKVMDQHILWASLQEEVHAAHLGL
jgi:hypothetical protein